MEYRIDDDPAMVSAIEADFERLFTRLHDDEVRERSDAVCCTLTFDWFAARWRALEMSMMHYGGRARHEYNRLFQRLVRRALALMLEGVPRIGEEDVRDGDTLRRSVWALHLLVALESTQITTPKTPLRLTVADWTKLKGVDRGWQRRLGAAADEARWLLRQMVREGHFVLCANAVECFPSDKGAASTIVMGDSFLLSAHANAKKTKKKGAGGAQVSTLLAQMARNLGQSSSSSAVAGLDEHTRLDEACRAYRAAKEALVRDTGHGTGHKLDLVGEDIVGTIRTRVGGYEAERRERVEGILRALEAADEARQTKSSRPEGVGKRGPLPRVAREQRLARTAVGRLLREGAVSLGRKPAVAAAAAAEEEEEEAARRRDEDGRGGDEAVVVVRSGRQRSSGRVVLVEGEDGRREEGVVPRGVRLVSAKEGTLIDAHTGTRLVQARVPEWKAVAVAGRLKKEARKRARKSESESEREDKDEEEEPVEEVRKKRTRKTVAKKTVGKTTTRKNSKKKNKKKGEAEETTTGMTVDGTYELDEDADFDALLDEL